MSSAAPLADTMYGLFDNGSPIAGRSELVQQIMSAAVAGTGTNTSTFYRTGNRNAVPMVPAKS